LVESRFVFNRPGGALSNAHKKEPDNKSLSLKSHEATDVDHAFLE